MPTYDYIITGGGCAGLSLVYHLLHSSLQSKRILIIERLPKTENDRTWCFWENGEGPFESIVCQRWEHLWIYQGNVAQRLDILPYRYKMIRGIDFYKKVEDTIRQFPNVERVYAMVEQITDTAGGVVVKAGDHTYSAAWCFNSILFNTIPREQYNYLDQHFCGWFIQTKHAAFRTDEAILMDFRTPQHGESRFLYVLPTAATEALVEVAIFSNQHLSVSGYDEIIGKYLKEQWPQLEHYNIVAKEMGIIPMTDYPFRQNDGRIIHIGTAGGDTKGSTGYTFHRIQKRTSAIVKNLEENHSPVFKGGMWKKRFAWYDSMLLRVLEAGYYPGDILFQKLFARNSPQTVLRFLNDESTVKEEIRIIVTLPVFPFLKAMFKEAMRRKLAAKPNLPLPN